MVRYYNSAISKPTQDIKVWVCYKCDHQTTGDEVLKVAKEKNKRATCPKCGCELVGRME
jgi:ribosomal protein L37AE/L43A